MHHSPSESVQKKYESSATNSSMSSYIKITLRLSGTKNHGQRKKEKERKTKKRKRLHSIEMWSEEIIAGLSGELPLDEPGTAVPCCLKSKLNCKKVLVQQHGWYSYLLKSSASQTWRICQGAVPCMEKKGLSVCLDLTRLRFTYDIHPYIIAI